MWNGFPLENSDRRMEPVCAIVQPHARRRTKGKDPFGHRAIMKSECPMTSRSHCTGGRNIAPGSRAVPMQKCIDRSESECNVLLNRTRSRPVSVVPRRCQVVDSRKFSLACLKSRFGGTGQLWTLVCLGTGWSLVKSLITRVLT